MAKLKKHKLSKKVHIREKKKKRLSKEMLITILIAGVMILSVFGIMFSSYSDQQQKETYGDYDFSSTADGWMTKLDDQKLYFTYSPSQLDALNVSSLVLSRLEAPVIIITFDPNSEQIDQIEAARLKLAQDLTIHFNKALMYGVTDENDLYNLTKYTCANATARIPIIELRAVDETKIPESELNQTQEVGTNIHLEGSCVVIASRERDWLGITERLIYGMFGIIE
ncbi:hypothetical protein ACFL96_04600 [Thermoproteota archaeon]